MTLYKRPSATEWTSDRERGERNKTDKKTIFLSVARHYVFTLHLDFPVRKWIHALNASEACDATTSLLTFYTVRVLCAVSFFHDFHVLTLLSKLNFNNRNLFKRLELVIFHLRTSIALIFFSFGLCVSVARWEEKAKSKWNGEMMRFIYKIENGFLNIRKVWHRTETKKKIKILQNLTETNGMASRCVAFLSLDASNRKEMLSAIDYSLNQKK